MLLAMTDAVTAAPPAAPAAGTEEDQDQGGVWGRIMDGAGIVAGLALGAILIDIFTDGRFISRRLGWRRDEPGDQAPAEPVPDPGPGQ